MSEIHTWLIMYAPVAKKPTSTRGNTIPIFPASIPHGTASATVSAARRRIRQRVMIEAAANPTSIESRCRYRTVWYVSKSVLSVSCADPNCRGVAGASDPCST